MDHTGEVVDGDELLFVIAEYQQNSVGCQGVVGTLMSNLGFELALRDMDIPFARAKVGDRYVNEMMREKGWHLGGESSGHIICADVTTTGDGVVSALKVLLAIQKTGKTLFQLKNGMTKFPQTMVNVRVVHKVDLEQDHRVLDAVKDVEDRLANRGRVLLRPSGTEPVIRVMVEGEDGHLVSELANELAGVVQTIVS